MSEQKNWPPLHLTVSKNGQLSLWDSERTAKSIQNEYYCPIFPNEAQAALIEAAATRARTAPKLEHGCAQAGSIIKLTFFNEPMLAVRGHDNLDQYYTVRTDGYLTVVFKEESVNDVVFQAKDDPTGVVLAVWNNATAPTPAALKAMLKVAFELAVNRALDEKDFGE